ncbi:MAG: c-type cytochrome, partial [Flavobacteriaceae bacterium]
PGTLDEEGRLLEFASACGPMVYRGDAMPENYLGDAFVCEPTANLIKRNKVVEEGFMLSAKGAYADREFLASTDERFRPISLASGPDGNLYVVDMYKGVIQDAPYMTPYLKEVTLARKLDKPVHMGRIWRIKSKNAASTKPIDLASAHPKTLVEQLGSTNGWTRDMAQRLLVEKGDLSILPELKNQLAKGNALGQLHALWTLEGLGYDQPDLYLEALNAADPKVVQAAIRLCMASAERHPEIVEALETFIKSNYDGAASLVKMQMVLASHKIDAHLAFEIAIKFLDAYGQLPVARDVVMSSLENRESSFLALLLSRPAWKTYDQSHEIFTEMLATAIANKGEHQEIEQLFRIAGSSPGPDQIWIKEALFNGIINSRGSNDSGELVLDQMPDLLSRSEVPDALTRKLNWPGKPVKEKMASDTTFEIDSKVYAMGRQKFLNLCANCHGTQGEGMARFAPPLKHSEWVNGPEHKLAMILLHGMEGPITVNGKKYDNPDILPVMPSFSTLQNEDIAAIATYIRNSWGNVQPPISSRTVWQIRFRTQGQITPWKASELDTLVFDSEL